MSHLGCTRYFESCCVFKGAPEGSDHCCLQLILSSHQSCPGSQQSLSSFHLSLKPRSKSVLDILSHLIIAFQPRSLNPQAIDLSAVPLACSPPSLLTLRFIFLIVLHVSFHTCVFMTTLPCGLPFGDGLPDFSCFALVFKSGLHLSRCAHVPPASRSH